MLGEAVPGQISLLIFALKVFTFRILRLKEAGLTQLWYEKYTPKSIGCDSITGVHGRAIGLKDIQGILIGVLAMIALAITVLVAENIYYWSSHDDLLYQIFIHPLFSRWHWSRAT